MLATAVETVGFAALAASAWLRVGLWAALLVAGLALVLAANVEIGKKPTRVIRIQQGTLTNSDVDLTADAPLTNGAVDHPGV